VVSGTAPTIFAKNRPAISITTGCPDRYTTPIDASSYSRIALAISIGSSCLTASRGFKVSYLDNVRSSIPSLLAASCRRKQDILRPFLSAIETSAVVFIHSFL